MQRYRGYAWSPACRSFWDLQTPDALGGSHIYPPPHSRQTESRTSQLDSSSGYTAFREEDGFSPVFLNSIYIVALSGYLHSTVCGDELGCIGIRLSVSPLFYVEPVHRALRLLTPFLPAPQHSMLKRPSRMA